MRDPRSRAALLREVYAAAVSAANPFALTARALSAEPVPPAPVFLLAAGKASAQMAAAACEALAQVARVPAGGVVIAPERIAPPHPALRTAAGDHPAPGAQSRAASHMIGDAISTMPLDAVVWVLLSGGASSLLGAPAHTISSGELDSLNAVLLHSGRQIGEVNLLRSRALRWGAGRMAAALAPRTIRCFILSDVIGNDPRAIGSGPCAPPQGTDADVRALAVALTASARNAAPLLARLARDGRVGSDLPGAPAFANVRTTIVGDNATATLGAAAATRARGIPVTVVAEPLVGEAWVIGARLARTLLVGDAPGCIIWGGETTVTLGSNAGTGGRSQELALAAARALRAHDGMSLLAAGTDGCDGPTDAAGAVVDGATWDAIMHAGRDPARDLERHNSYAALDAAGSLLRTGLTGTNVADIVIAYAG
ncbi:MAG: DUF4147 domain-containing protein [Gemmatimonadota bacterium]